MDNDKVVDQDDYRRQVVPSSVSFDEEDQSDDHVLCWQCLPYCLLRTRVVTHDHPVRIPIPKFLLSSRNIGIVVSVRVSSFSKSIYCLLVDVDGYDLLRYSKI